MIASDDHEWRASADGNGAIDALYRAVDKALAGVLAGHPGCWPTTSMPLARGPTRSASVTVRIAPPAGRGRARQGRVRAVRRAGRTSSRPRSRRTSWPSTRCSPRSTGRARRRRPGTGAASGCRPGRPRAASRDRQGRGRRTTPPPGSSGSGGVSGSGRAVAGGTERPGAGPEARRDGTGAHPGGAEMGGRRAPR